jgi:hypothetical protein
MFYGIGFILFLIVSLLYVNVWGKVWLFNLWWFGFATGIYFGLWFSTVGKTYLGLNDKTDSKTSSSLDPFHSRKNN